MELKDKQEPKALKATLVQRETTETKVHLEIGARRVPMVTWAVLERKVQKVLKDQEGYPDTSDHRVTSGLKGLLDLKVRRALLVFLGLSGLLDLRAHQEILVQKDSAAPMGDLDNQGQLVRQVFLVLLLCLHGLGVALLMETPRATQKGKETLFQRKLPRSILSNVFTSIMPLTASTRLLPMTSVKRMMISETR